MLDPGFPWPGPWVSLAASRPPLDRLERGGWAGSLAGDTGFGPGTSLAWQEQLPWQLRAVSAAPAPVFTSEGSLHPALR